MTTTVLFVEHAHLGNVILIGLIIGFVAWYLFARWMRDHWGGRSTIKDYSLFLMILFYLFGLLGVIGCAAFSAKVSMGTIYWRFYEPHVEGSQDYHRE